MKSMSDDVLLDSYRKAVDLQLEAEFVELLLKEIRRRELAVPEKKIPPLRTG
jgi:developmental checkpoint coupling sporulation initiation to replication initiation